MGPHGSGRVTTNVSIPRSHFVDKGTHSHRGLTALVWPITGLALGLVLSVTPFRPSLSLVAGVCAWCANILLVAILSGHRVGARIGALLAGLFMTVPLFVSAYPLARGLLACFMCVPLAAATVLALAPPIAGFRARLAHLCAWSDTYPLRWYARRFDAPALRHLCLATAVMALGIAMAKFAAGQDNWLPVRWLGGSIAALALGEMITSCQNLVMAALGVIVPPLFRSPHRSVTVSEFWAKRWNLITAEALRRFCFEPLGRRRAALAMVVTFAVSAVAHALLTFFALGEWQIAVVCGVFFLVQPMLLSLERWMKVRRWAPAKRRSWTLGALLITSPLVIEPFLRIVERGWGDPNSILPPTAAVLAFVIVLSSFVPLAALLSRR